MPGLFVSHLPSSQNDPRRLTSSLIESSFVESTLAESTQIERPGVETMSWRRSGHGSSAVPQRPQMMIFRQPQDGAPEPSSRRVATLPSAHPSLSGEPEDARLTGGTRSLMRRVLGLNVAAPLRSAIQRSGIQLTTAPRRAVRSTPGSEPQVA